MFGFKLLLLLSLCFTPDALGAPLQEPMSIESLANRPRRKLRGRFLHVTDMHPDPYYKEDASEKSACHRRKPKKSQPRSSYFGMPFSDCDAPYSLTNYTLDFLEDEWSDEIDFVIWTGDSARHDNDRKKPRTTDEIYMLNRVIAERMEEAFLSKGIPVIPSIGNNDIWPHNIMLPGPNSITAEFASIWRAFVPFASYQVFQRGGYYAVEVIPDEVAAISLNTMYFFHSNTAVGGCDPSDSEDPGNLQFDWLEVQLESFRSRGMQVYLTGHVPPSSDNFFPECYSRYTEVSLRYQDTILGHLYGHMNADHFFLLRAEDMDVEHVKGNMVLDDAGIPQALGKKKALYKTLLKGFEELPKPSRNFSYDDYGVVNVSPSVVPNPYLPSFRIFAYNTTGTPYTPHVISGDRHSEQEADHQSRGAGFCDHRDTRRCRLSRPWYSSSKSPSRMNRLWTPIGYAQFYLPKLEKGTKKHPPKFKLEYTTFPLEQLRPVAGASDTGFAYPIPPRHLPKSVRNGTKSTSKFAPYGLEDLTIPSWTDLAHRLGEGVEKNLRKRFRRYMYMGGVEE